MIVAIEGASTDLSVALAEPEGELIAEDAWASAQRQSAELLPHLLALFESAGRRLGDARAIAVGIGPGSFTGLRVALALGKGLAVALELPILGIPSLQAWLAAHPAAKAAVARAGAREAYLLPRGEETPTVMDREELAALVRAAPVVAPSELAEDFGLQRAQPPRAASAVASIAASRLAKSPVGDDLGALEPIYLRPPRGLEAQTREQVRWL